jgi:hypothetical protein
MYIIKPMKKIYYLFEVNKEGEEASYDLLFSDEKYLWYKLALKKFTLVSFLFPNQAYHYFFDEQNVFIQFHIGDEFISFLKERQVKHISYELSSIEGEKNETMNCVDGRVLELRAGWVTTGYEYAIYEKEFKDPLDIFHIPKSGKIELGPLEKKASISLKHQGTSDDPIMQGAYKDMKTSKKYGCFFGIIFIILLIVVFYFFGHFIHWFGDLIGFS